MRAGPPARLEDPRTAAAASGTLWATGRGLLGGRGVDSKMARVASQQLEEDISAQSHDSESWSDSELETKGAARGRAKERGQESAEEYDEDAEIDGLDDDGDATTTDGETEERARTLRRRPRTTRGEKNPGAAAWRIGSINLLTLWCARFA